MHAEMSMIGDRKSIDKVVKENKPFADGSNPELLRTADEQFKIIGNRFACMQYQSVLVPVETQNMITIQFLKASLRFAVDHPHLTLMYNALNAGKTVPTPVLVAQLPYL